MKYPFALPENQPLLRYWFGGFRLEADGSFLSGEKQLELPPDELAVLRLLLSRAGKAVSLRDLKQIAWGNEQIASGVVDACIDSLRARLQPLDCIQPAYKRGYRFTVAVQSEGMWPAGQLKRLAVAPFITGNGVPEYMGPAIAEETMEQLNGGRQAVATILARDSISTLARRGLSAQEMGKALNAELVLTGSINACAGRLRLRTEMIRVEDGAQLWVDELLARGGRTTELAKELTARLLSRLEASDASLSAAAEDRQTKGNEAQQAEAREIYLHAHSNWQTLERHRMQDAMGQLQRAIELDPSLDAARVDLGHLCVMQAQYGFLPPLIAARIVRHVALEDRGTPGLCERVLPALGWIQFHVDRNLPAALEAFARTSHLPHDPWITRMRSSFWLSRHRFEEAIALLRDAIRVDPYSAWLHARLAWALHLAEERRASVEEIRKTITQFPEHADGHFYGAMILAYNGDITRALELSEAFAARSPHFDLAMDVHAYVLACSGQAEEALTLLEQLQWLSRERYVLNAFQAAVFAVLGGVGAAVEELSLSNESRSPWFFQMLADPRLKSLKGHPGFERLMSVLTQMENEAEAGVRPLNLVAAQG